MFDPESLEAFLKRMGEDCTNLLHGDLPKLQAACRHASDKLQKLNELADALVRAESVSHYNNRVVELIKTIFGEDYDEQRVSDTGIFNAIAAY